MPQLLKLHVAIDRYRSCKLHKLSKLTVKKKKVSEKMSTIKVLPKPEVYVYIITLPE